MKAAVYIDTWKLPIFKRHLEGAGFAFTQSEELRGRMTGTLLLSVECASAAQLRPTVEAAQAECHALHIEGCPAIRPGDHRDSCTCGAAEVIKKGH